MSIAGGFGLYGHQWWLGSSLRSAVGINAKGVSVAQVAKITKAFTDAGVLVHAYLMYGFLVKPPKKLLMPWNMSDS